IEFPLAPRGCRKAGLAGRPRRGVDVEHGQPMMRDLGFHVRRRNLIGLLQLDRLEAGFRRGADALDQGEFGKQMAEIGGKARHEAARGLAKKRDCAQNPRARPTAITAHHRVGYRPIIDDRPLAAREPAFKSLIFAGTHPSCPPLWWDGLWLTEAAAGSSIPPRLAPRRAVRGRRPAT